MELYLPSYMLKV